MSDKSGDKDGELARDAARYRWLLTNADYDSPTDWPWVVLAVNKEKIRFTSVGWDSKINEAIDAAISAGEG